VHKVQLEPKVLTVSKVQLVKTEPTARTEPMDLTAPKASPELRAQLVSKVTLASKARPDLRVTKV
jgi:hypothetical protein